MSGQTQGHGEPSLARARELFVKSQEVAQACAQLALSLATGDLESARARAASLDREVAAFSAAVSSLNKELSS